MKKVGIIYKVTNTVNGKLYIGQTRSYEDKKERAASKRLGEHFYSAKKKLERCIIFERAIRKYGKKSFKVETITYCELSSLNYLEIAYIEIYDTTNRKYGYNISKGGSGLRGYMTEERRKNISKGQKPKHEVSGIVEKYRDGKFIGYRAQRKQNGKQYEKLFSVQSKSLEENLKLAKQYIDNIKNGKYDDYNSFNRKEDLPQNIYKEPNEKGILVGYRFQIKKSKKTYCKVFTNKDLTLNEKYDLVTKEKNKFKDMEKKFKDKQINQNTYDKYLEKLLVKPVVHDLPRNIKREFAGGKVVGYRFQMKVNKKLHYKVYKHSKLPMEEKLNKAIKAKEDFLEQLRKNQ